MKPKITLKTSKNKSRASTSKKTAVRGAKSLLKTSRRIGRRKARRALQPRFFRPNAAGIDIGATELFAAVPADRDVEPVRSFGTFTSDLRAMAQWLLECGIDTVAMESTGVYWIPVFQILEEAGLEVCLVNARHVKNVPGRKSDVKDCQWLQYLHSVGLLEKSFRPSGEMCAIRSILRHRQNLIEASNAEIQHIHKCLTQMNLQIHHVLSDITGQSGLRMLEAILAGERDPARLAGFRNKQVRASLQDIVKSLEGDYRPEHLFVLGQALAAYRFTMGQVQACDDKVLAMMQAVEPADGSVALENPQKFETAYDRTLAEQTARLAGVDLTSIDGVSAWAASNLVSEIGCDISAWPSSKHFCSWLALCPDNRISGGKILSSRTRKAPSRARYILRMCAHGVVRSKGPIGDYFRKMRARLGPAQAKIATAHKIARLIYHCLKTRTPYSHEHARAEMQRAELARFKRLRRQAENMGYLLVPDLAKMRAKMRSARKSANETTCATKT
jgi:transposase